MGTLRIRAGEYDEAQKQAGMFEAGDSKVAVGPNWTRAERNAVIGLIRAEIKALNIQEGMALDKPFNLETTSIIKDVNDRASRLVELAQTIENSTPEQLEKIRRSLAAYILPTEEN